MIKRDFYLNRLIHNMWNSEIKVITGKGTIKGYFDRIQRQSYANLRISTFV